MQGFALSFKLSAILSALYDSFVSVLLKSDTHHTLITPTKHKNTCKANQTRLILVNPPQGLPAIMRQSLAVNIQKYPPAKPLADKQSLYITLISRLIFSCLIFSCLI